MAPGQIIDVELLRAVIARIIPADADPGALELGADRFVLAHFADYPADAALIGEGLSSLAAGFTELGAIEQDGALLAVENAPWFARLVTLTSEGFYADPDNGGNDGARSWTMMGYRHGLPEGPSGPPRPRNVL